MDTVTIPKALFNRIIEVLKDHQFSADTSGEFAEEYNNDDVIELLKELEKIK